MSGKPRYFSTKKMNYTRKMVLIPIEQYERLLKRKHTEAQSGAGKSARAEPPPPPPPPGIPAKRKTDKWIQLKFWYKAMNKTMYLQHLFFMNNTLCDFIQSFSISGNVYVSICLYQETFRIDLRFFINKKATIKGLHLTTEQWQRLIKIIPIINNVLSRLSYKQ